MYLHINNLKLPPTTSMLQTRSARVVSVLFTRYFNFIVHLLCIFKFRIIISLIELQGTLLDGTVIAVKQLSSGSNQGKREFVNEIGMISSLRHPNLVRLHGCCAKHKQLLLVYEFLENNSLARALFGRFIYISIIKQNANERFFYNQRSSLWCRKFDRFPHFSSHPIWEGYNFEDIQFLYSYVLIFILNLLVDLIDIVAGRSRGISIRFELAHTAKNLYRHRKRPSFPP